MFAPILARIPGSVFFQALKDGEPMAYVMLVGVIVFTVVAVVVKKVMEAQR